MERWPPPVYRATTTFRAPLPYVFRWCTNYQRRDSRLIGETFERRILARQRRRVLFEDLWWEPDGWRWRRTDVALHPPDRWVAESLGNVREAHIEYRLTALPNDKTRLDITMRRRPTRRVPRQPPRAELERELDAIWRDYAHALERDLRTIRPIRVAPRTGTRPRQR